MKTTDHPSFGRLAWGAFIFASLTTRKDSREPDPAYQCVIRDTALLHRLQNEPRLDDFRVLREFLTKYGVHFARKDLPNQLATVFPDLKPTIGSLATCSLANTDLAKVKQEIVICYEILTGPRVWGGDTVASKLLHFLNPDLFVMWDDSIRNKIPGTGTGCYLTFLKRSQESAQRTIEDFNRRQQQESLENYLSQRLGYLTTRPLTKFLDDCNWVFITKNWPDTPPSWLLRFQEGFN